MLGRWDFLFEIGTFLVTFVHFRQGYRDMFRVMLLLLLMSEMAIDFTPCLCNFFACLVKKINNENTNQNKTWTTTSPPYCCVSIIFSTRHFPSVKSWHHCRLQEYQGCQRCRRSLATFPSLHLKEWDLTTAVYLHGGGGAFTWNDGLGSGNSSDLGIMHTLSGGFKYLFKFLFLLGEMIQFDEHIFLAGWNHHLD